MDLITQLPVTQKGNDAIVVFVDKLSKMVHIAPCKTTCGAEEFANIFMHEVHRLHGMPRKIVSDRDSRFQGRFFSELSKIMGCRQAMSTAIPAKSDTWSKACQGRALVKSGHWQGHTGIGIWVQKHFVSSEGALYLKMPWPRL